MWAVFVELIEEVGRDTIVELGAFLGSLALHMVVVSRNLLLSVGRVPVRPSAAHGGWSALHYHFQHGVRGGRRAAAAVHGQHHGSRRGGAGVVAVLLHIIHVHGIMLVGRVREPHRGGRWSQLPIGMCIHQPDVGRAPPLRCHVRP